jgi:Domain of unknown function (DUF4386)
LRPASRIGPIAAVTGALLLLIGTYLHPMGADPNVPLAAFTEYAASYNWVAVHLMQLIGVVSIAASLVLLSRKMADGPAAEWAILGAAGAVASLAIASALQAVDGVALKAMVNSWASVSDPGKAALFDAAFAVRQIEIGLASIGALMFGLTVSIYGIALLIDRRFPKWIGALAIVGGAPTAIGGIAMAYAGFSDLAMTINMPANSLLILWMIALGIYGWKWSAF